MRALAILLRMKVDVLSVIEAAYRVELPEEDWVAGIMKSARPFIDVGLGVYAYVFDASDPAKLGVRAFSCAGQPEDVKVEELVDMLARTPKEYVEQSWRTRACAFASEVPGFHDLAGVTDYLRPRGIEDIFAVSGVDPTGHGCYVGAARPEVAKLDAHERAMWERVAAHLASGFRLRRALGTTVVPPPASVMSGAEAVLTPNGKMEYAEPAAVDASAREALRDAVRRIDRARGKMRRADPGHAVEEWRGLVAARWSLVEHFESDGRRYLVARRNDPDAAGPDSLTRRERQVLGYAALGHSNKLIAYELGISASTVGVLLLRAARKLKAHGRAEVIAAWRAACTK